MTVYKLFVVTFLFKLSYILDVYKLVVTYAFQEYIDAGSCCAQILWMKNQLQDYGLSYSKIPIYCDNQSAIVMTENLVQHSLIKHISIRYHFIREHLMEGSIELYFAPTDQQLADIFTKPLVEAVFIKLVNELGMVSMEK